MRHRWIDRQRTYGSWRSRCERCGMKKDERFAGGTHWNEYQKVGGKWEAPDKAPPCEPVAEPTPT